MNTKLGYFSSYDRGLIHLLKMWPKIIEKYPDATLDVFYGWNLFDKGYADNPQMMAWKEKMVNLMKQKGITEHGRVSKDELREWQKKLNIWAYPTDFGETNCITALDCQAQGCVPCVINYAGLKETVGSGVRIDGDIYDEETQEAYLGGLFKLMSGGEYYQQEQERGREFAKNFTWDVISSKWLEQI